MIDFSLMIQLCHSAVLASAQGLGVPLLLLPPTSSTLLYVFASNWLMKLLPCHYWEFFSVAPLSIMIYLSLSNAMHGAVSVSNGGGSSHFIYFFANKFYFFYRKTLKCAVFVWKH